MLKPILELLSSSSEALGFCHRFITGSVPVSFFSSFHSQRIHGSFFFSLFNFQGPSCASRFQSLSALDYLTTFGLICQVLFQLFSRPSLFARSLFREAWLSYHTRLDLSSTFFNFFRALTFLWEVSLSGDLTILPHSVWFVKYFFEKSFSPRLSAWLLSRESLTMISHRVWFVKGFFQVFEKTFLTPGAVQTRAWYVIIVLLRFAPQRSLLYDFFPGLSTPFFQKLYFFCALPCPDSILRKAVSVCPFASARICPQ